MLSEEDDEHSEPNVCCPFGKKRKGKKGKGSPLWVNCKREERCMAGVVDVAGMREMHG